MRLCLSTIKFWRVKGVLTIEQQLDRSRSETYAMNCDKLKKNYKFLPKHRLNILLIVRRYIYLYLSQSISPTTSDELKSWQDIRTLYHSTRSATTDFSPFIYRNHRLAPFFFLSKERNLSSLKETNKMLFS